MTFQSTVVPPAACAPVQRYAAIDIGTVTCRMLVADVDKGGAIHEVRREYAITNLGEGVDASGMLKPEAMQRVAAVVKNYLEIVRACSKKNGTDVTVIALATSASRDAKNAAEFVALLGALGLKLAVIPGEREAALSFLGASCDFLGEDLMVVDIGGGSTEIVAGRAGENPLQSHSFNIGCRRITEKFFTSDPPTSSQVAQACAWITQHLDAYFAELRDRGFNPERLVAVAGTATSVVAVHKGMQVYDSSRVHRFVVGRNVLDDVYGRLATVSLDQRKTTVGLDPGRAAVIVAGLVILQEVLSLAGVESFTASESDILQGIILDAAK